MLTMWIKNQKIKLWLNCLIMLVISTQSIMARADTHQLHLEDASFLSIDEHSHLISTSGVIEQTENINDEENAGVPRVDCEHGHIHVSSQSFVSICFVLSVQVNHSVLFTTMDPLRLIGIHTLPFRPPIS
ncbi:MAG: hypothetical protein COB36_09890 [Alphaproteobacteria bacterium]|nr:MAG: hypothetical protein COB36_09890 [Alphaproteobacteria bacterium]